MWHAIAAALVACAIVPLTLIYYRWLARAIAPRVLWLPLPVGMTIIACCVAAPWLVVLALVWTWG
ncbi:MAG: hypothetical protein M9890_03110 [Thermomicrobiales bacterium]|nr:hypothetical protein [Thermomicrobiales bacterium]